MTATVPAGVGSEREPESQPSSAGSAEREAVLQSANIGQLAEALSKAQGEIKAPSKERTAKIEGGKASYSYKYADLSDVIEAYRVALSKNALALTHGTLQRDGHLVLMTKLLHKSGEWLASEYPLQVYARPQEMGSALTYARRYMVSALLGIAAEEDDDGKRAQDAQPRQREEDPAEIDADSAAIVDAAQELEQHTGKEWRQIVRAESEFKGKEGDQLWFEDPTQKGYRLAPSEDGKPTPKVERTIKPSTKWKTGVRRKLEDELKKRNDALSPQITDADVPF